MQVKPIVCSYCKKEFEPSNQQLGQVKRGLRAYCSAECYSAARRLRRRKRKKIDLKKEVMEELDYIYQPIADKIRDDVLNIADKVEEAIKTKTKAMRNHRDIAKAIIWVACDKNRIGYRVRADRKSMRYVRSITKIPPPKLEDILMTLIQFLAESWSDGCRKKVISKAKEICSATKMNASPTVLAGAIAYLACIQAGCYITQSEIVKATGSTDTSIRNVCRQILRGGFFA